MGEITDKKQMAIILAEDILNGAVQVITQEMTLTIADTLNKPVLKHIFRDDKMQTGFNVIKLLIARFLDNFGFTNKPTESEIESITVDTLEHFGYESLEDIIIFFKMARSGKFGTAHRRVDSNFIFGEWFPKYMELKTQQRELILGKQRNQLNETPLTIEEVKQMRYEKETPKRFRDKIQKARDRIDEITATMDRHDLDTLIDYWENHSDYSDCKPYVYLLKNKRNEFKKRK